MKDPIPNYETLTIQSEKVNEIRTINIWTPPNYKNNTTLFPVIYMLDGGIKVDFPHIANTISILVKNNSISPIILIGIENTERRRDLTGLSDIVEDKEIAPLNDGAKSFRAFIEDELFIEINKQYRTTKEKRIVDESVAGLFIIETFLLKPEMFDFYIAMDPSLWWNNHHLVKNVNNLLAEFSTKENKLWFAGSDAEDISQYTKELSQILKNNAPESLRWHYSNEPTEKHNTIFRATKERAIIWSLKPTKNE
ncbi:alpha/beta hydrolase [Urechidicola croceus]|uniref:alpha/beta hydrolase n=1 Tax=Urechidicola croceus TaxID=1850246 RepID=UPI0009F2FE12|nr:alpha/beta hydrolase-fold protein [Urechidicola croceus]